MRINIAGQRFGKWIVIEYFGYSYWKCRCDCSTIKNVCERSLLRGKSKSCGCYKLEKPNNVIHRMSKTRFYRTFANIKSRCFNSNNKNYNNYGGRGITICNRWLDFNNFKQDMYESYLQHVEKFGEKNTSIERIDVNGNYKPSNCKWATNSEQQRNKRKPNYDRVFYNQKLFKAIDPDGVEYVEYNQSKFAREHNLNQGHLGECLRKERNHNKGWKFEYIIE